MRGVLGVITLALSLALPASGARDAALDRATKVRPDDVRGPQIHAIYVIPSDGV